MIKKGKHHLAFGFVCQMVLKQNANLSCVFVQRQEEMKTLQEQVEKAERRHAAVDEQVSWDNTTTCTCVMCMPAV